MDVNLIQFFTSDHVWQKKKLLRLAGLMLKFTKSMEERSNLQFPSVWLSQVSLEESKRQWVIPVRECSSSFYFCIKRLHRILVRVNPCNFTRVLLSSLQIYLRSRSETFTSCGSICCNTVTRWLELWLELTCQLLIPSFLFRSESFNYNFTWLLDTKY